MISIEKNGDVYELTQQKTDDMGWSFTVNVNEVPSYGGMSPKRFSTKSFEKYVDTLSINQEDEVDDTERDVEIDEILEANREARKREKGETLALEQLFM